MILDFEISPSDDARKEIAAVLTRIDKFLQDRENGLAHASKQDLEAYLKQMFNFSTDVISMVVHKESYELTLELGYVKVDCKLKRY
ncbi:hypothetical protein ACUHMQ_00555 [Chitinimonas sp. PSY-7]|uniref:hypothetical protein n=1 Tax=Chitinimonas sp. PSY-7 TaxID=3459088 RepID=UPI00404022D4